MDQPGQAVGHDPERRGAPRAQVRLEAAYEDRDRQVFLVARDLSETGAWLQAPDPPAAGRRARLTLELPGVAPLVRVRATVVRRGPDGFALRFESGRATAETRAALRNFVEQSINAGR